MTLKFSSSPLVLSLLAAALVLSGCANAPKTAPSCKPLSGSTSATKGAVIGAAAGAVVGGLIGSKVANKSSVGARNGALLGAIGGALAGSAYAKHISMTEQADGTVKLNIPGRVMFGVGSSEINPEFRSTLDSVAGVVAEYCDVNARITGHTDSTGDAGANRQLSFRRANSVQQYLSGALRDKRVTDRHFAVDGLGEDQPIASNTTEEGRSQNRRVEIFLIPPKS